MRNNEEQTEVNNSAVRKPQGNNIHVLSFKLIVAILGREGFLPPPSPLLQKKKTKAILLIEDFCVRIRLKHFELQIKPDWVIIILHVWKDQTIDNCYSYKYTCNQ